MDKALLAELEGLKQKDDETRQKLLREGRHYGHYEEEMQRVHIENTVSPGRIVSLYGWPGISKVG